VDHPSEWILVIFRDNNVTAPGGLLCVCSTLDVTNAFVNREWHSVAGDDGVKDDIGVCELAVHAIEGFNQLPRYTSACARYQDVINVDTWYFQALDP
jgi:hypothetical protein